MICTMSSDMRVGSISVRPGEKNTSFLRIGELPSSDVNLPLMIISGKTSSPTLCVTAGIHACEYSGMKAMMDLFNKIDPVRLRGTLLMVPVVNTIGFQAKTPYVCPVDNLNLNRLFPGNNYGSISQRIVYTLFNEIMLKADYFIDLHGGDVPEGHVDIVYYETTGNRDVDRVSVELAMHFAKDYAEDMDPPIPGSSMDTMARRGIPAIVAESGEYGRLEDAHVNFHVDGLMNVMRYLGMIEGMARKAEPTLLKGRTKVTVNRGGFFTMKTRVGDVLEKGGAIGTVTDLFGDVIEETTSPVNGIVVMSFPCPAVAPGDTVAVVSNVVTRHGD